MKGQHEGLYPDTYDDTFFDKEMPKKHKDNETSLDKYCHENPEADECRIYDD